MYYARDVFEIHIHFPYARIGGYIGLDTILYNLNCTSSSSQPFVVASLLSGSTAIMHILFIVSLSLSALTALTEAKTHNFDWNITWVTANPDGLQPRPVIGINNEWPLPLLNFTKGDRVIANVYNGLGNQSTSVHFHGFFQNGTTEMDGPPGVTQCNIPPGETMLYNFTVSDQDPPS